MIPADGDNIALAEAFQHYSLWYLGDPQPFPEEQDKEVTDAWWADTVRRRSEALSSFKAALEREELTVKVFDTQRNMSFAITPAEWRDHRPFAGFLSSIDAGVIKESEGDSLAKYNGLAPYVARGEFNAWFARQKGLAAERGKRGRGAPATKREIAKAALRARYPNGVPPRELSNAAVAAQIAQDLAANGGPTISSRTIDKARHDLEGTKRGLRARKNNSCEFLPLIPFFAARFCRLTRH